jgi:alkaline phosphatase
MRRCAAALTACSLLMACGRDSAPGVAAAQSAPAVAQSAPAAAQSAPAAAPKVVLVIGDGMDDQQITIARNYLVGQAGRLTLDGSPRRAAVQVQTVAEEAPHAPEYVPDSANTATSMAAGIVTSAGRIGTTAGTDRDVPSIVELAVAQGFGTGVVTTSSVTDATPASFLAHVSSRLCEGPRGMVAANARSPASGRCSQDLKANGGKGSIAEQIAATSVDIVLGGGTAYFEQTAEGETERTVHDLAVANGFRVIEKATELSALSRGEKVLGLFAPGTMPVQWRGAGDMKAERVQRSGDRPVLPEPFGCEPNPSFAGMPLLTAMTEAALTQLDDGRSFVLVVESASIDKQSHLRRPCGQIGELAQLDAAVGIVFEYARAHPETLVLVTADHGHAAQLVPETSVLAGLGAASPGHFARVRTPEGVLLGVNYATNDSAVQEDHSGVHIPLFAFGAGADEVPTFLRQAEIFTIMARHLGLEPTPARE